MLACGMRTLVEALCSERCAGRAAGTPGGVEARRIVVDALRAAGLDPGQQAVERCGGANVLAVLPGDIDRWIVIGAHYDHLGRLGRDTYHGADDNAAAVAILVRVAGALAAKRAAGRGVVIAAFDAEEPPYFGTDGMGSEAYARAPAVPLERTDMMGCMALVGHALGPAGVPAEVAQTVFALGAERSAGTAGVIDGLAAVPGVVVRRADAEIVPPLSDYQPFWQRGVPFLFLTNGRWRYYHTPEDTPEKLDHDKMAATASWLEAFARASCAMPEGEARFLRDARDDRGTLESLVALTTPLAAVSDEAAQGRDLAAALLAACGADGRLPSARRPQLDLLVQLLESGLA
jgi:Zn-dependent M28 family amino/carboxypeptidase